MEKRKAKIQEFDFIRTICALWIVIYHFSCYTHSSLSVLHYNANAQWGSPVVAVFFMLSGAVLRYNYREIDSLSLFYYKRWKSIFPAFYLAFAFLFLQNVFAYGDLFYLGEPWKLIFTVLGIDGYVNFPNYYIIGEWFLGALIILYVLFPLVNKLRNKKPVLTTVIILALYIGCIFTNLVPMYKFREIPVCLLEMYFGILIIDHKEKVLDNKWSFLPALIVCLLLIVVEFPWPNILVMCELPATILGCALFIVLYRVGTLAMSSKHMRTVCVKLGALSYPIFLLQHVIIEKMTNYQNPYSLGGGILILFLTIVLTIVFAEVLSVVTKAVLESRLYLKVEKRIIGKNI